MSKTLPVWAATPIGLGVGAVLGTIIGSFYLSLALGHDLLTFDLLAVWKQSNSTWRLNPDAMKVAFGSVGFLALGCGVLAFVWTFQKQREDYGSAHWGLVAWTRH